MAIAYSGGTLVKTTINGSNKSTCIANMGAALVSAGWTESSVSGGKQWTSATTEDGLSCYFTLVDSGGSNYLMLKFYAPDGTNIIPNNPKMFVDTSGGTRTYEFIANRYSCWMYTLGNFTNNDPIGGGIEGGANCFAFGVPYLPDPVKPLTVVSATNTSPIVVVTSATHEMLTGQSIYITGALGNTGANGSFVITRLDSVTFSLDGSVGNGTYTSGGLVGTPERISRFIYAWTNYGAYTLPNNGWRYSPYATGTTSGIGSFYGVMINGQNYTGVATNPILFGTTSYPWRGGRFTISEPYLKCTNTGTGSSMIQAQLWNAAIITGATAPAGDSLFTMDGHTWIIYNQGGSGVLDLAVAYV